MIDHIKPHKDDWSLLAKTPHMDGGDTAQREGAYYFAMALRGYAKPLWVMANRSLGLLEVPNQKGNYRRHPDKECWYSSDNVMSRDQMTPLICMMGEYGMNKRLFYAFLRWVSRLGFMNNTRRNGQYETRDKHFTSKFHHHSWDYSWKLPDFAPFHLRLFIRAFRAYPLWPILCVLDIDLLLGAVTKIFVGKFHKQLPYSWHRKVTKSADDINFIITLLQAKKRMPTPVSYLARRIYRKRKHMIYFGMDPGIKYYKTKSGPQSALQYYFNDGRNPPLDLVYKPLVEDM